MNVWDLFWSDWITKTNDEIFCRRTRSLYPENVAHDGDAKATRRRRAQSGNAENPCDAPAMLARRKLKIHAEYFDRPLVFCASVPQCEQHEPDSRCGSHSAGRGWIKLFPRTAQTLRERAFQSIGLECVRRVTGCHQTGRTAQETECCSPVPCFSHWLGEKNCVTPSRS